MKLLKNRLLSILTIMLLSGFYIEAQVTIGGSTAPKTGAILDLNSTVKGGLLLPNVGIADLGKIPASGFVGITAEQDNNTELTGTVVYNTNPKTGVGIYTWDGDNWNKLAVGGSVTLNLSSGTGAYVADGSSESSYTSSDPSCNSSGAFAFTWITGEQFIEQLTVLDAGAGKFSLKFLQNDQASSRQAIMLVTSPCGNTNTFAFVQDGDTTDCGTTAVPEIKSSNAGGSLSLCTDGAVFLYLTGYPNGNFIWTLNDVQVGTGNSLTATKPGRYIVYGDKIGCRNSDTVVVTLSSTTAPKPVSLIVTGNNGIACGSGGTVGLTVTRAVSGTVVWYRDGQRTSLTGSTVQAGTGSWQAVVEDGGCASIPTDPVTVSEDPDASIQPPVMMINGQTSNYKLCRNGSMYLEVQSPDPSLTYTWYKDNTKIGAGASMYYPVPGDERFILRLRATGSGCAGESFSMETVRSETVPSVPVINVSTGNVLCGGKTTLTASGGDSYRWFKNGSAIAGKSSSTITVEETGSYTVTAISAGGCMSAMSGAKEITASDFATAAWTSHPATVKEGETKTYSVHVDFPLGAVYKWELVHASSPSTGAAITNGQGSAAITVHFPSAGKDTVRCIVTTACGNALESPLQQEVAVNAGCTDARITSTSRLNVSAKAGQTSNLPVLTVTATGNPVTFQWYRGTSGNTSQQIAGATDASFQVPAADVAATGTVSYWCLVSAGGGCASASSPAFTVAVNPNPAVTLPGYGSFVGKTCFDIAEGNDNTNNCASLEGRAGQKTDFENRTVQDMSNTTPYSGVQVFTFSPNGKVSHVRFDYTEESGMSIDSIVPKLSSYATSNNISSPCKVTVYFRSSLNEDLKGVSRTSAYKVKLYAIYNSAAVYTNPSMDRKLELTASLYDCSCCGAKTNDGGWLNFMCHNLGANESLNPFNWVSNSDDTDDDIKGYLFQWGRLEDGHQKRNSAYSTTGHPTLDEYKNSPGKYTQFYKYYYGAQNERHYDWIRGNAETREAKNRWGDGSTTLNPRKGVNDPCPPGWKVPSMLQWTSIYGNANTSNAWTWTGNGYKIGESLYLPAAGRRISTSNIISATGTQGYYWSCTYHSKTYGYHLLFSDGSVDPKEKHNRAEGLSVRCVEE